MFCLFKNGDFLKRDRKDKERETTFCRDVKIKVTFVFFSPRKNSGCSTFAALRVEEGEKEGVSRRGEEGRGEAGVQDSECWDRKS